MKIICIDSNYYHNKSTRFEIQLIKSNPSIFMKPQSALLTQNKNFYYNQNQFKNIEYECEIVVKICKRGKNISIESANSYYNEVTVGINLIDKQKLNEIKKQGNPWAISKAFDDSAIVGEFIPLKQALDSQGQFNFHLECNNKIVQRGINSQMIYSIEEQIAYASKYFTLEEGDLLFTGSPEKSQSIQVGDNFQGFLNGKTLLKSNIKSIYEISNNETMFRQLNQQNNYKEFRPQPNAKPEEEEKVEEVKEEEKVEEVVEEPFVKAEPLPAPSYEQLQELKKEITELINTKTCGPQFVRLSYNDSIFYKKGEEVEGSPNAALRFTDGGEGAFAANACCAQTLELLKDLATKWVPSVLTNADLWAYAANVAIEVMGGPVILTRFGRVDAQSSKESVPEQKGRLVDDEVANPQHLRDIFHPKGFTDQEIVALYGHHTVGSMSYETSDYEGRWTKTENVFDNTYFTDIARNIWQHEFFNKKNKPYYRFNKYKTVILLSDYSLQLDSEFFRSVTKYHYSQHLFFEQFASAWQKLQELGTENLQTVDGLVDEVKVFQTAQQQIQEEEQKVEKEKREAKLAKKSKSPRIRRILRKKQFQQKQNDDEQSEQQEQQQQQED